MGDILSAEKAGRGWIMEAPPEMAKALGVEEGSVIVLYPREGGMSYEILPPLSPSYASPCFADLRGVEEAFAEMKRLGD